MGREFLSLAAALALAACASPEDPAPPPPPPPVVEEAPAPAASPAVAATIDPAPIATQGPVFAPVSEPEFPEPASYQRVREEAEGVLVLEIGSRTLLPADGNGPTIQLVGAIHIAESAFYTFLQAMLDRSDVVLYEGVGEETPTAGSATSENWTLYTKFATALGLVCQSDAMDESKASWRNSDLSLDELRALAKQSGAELSTLLSFLDGSSAMGRLASVLLDQMAKSPKMAAYVRYGIVSSERNSSSTSERAVETALGDGLVKDPALLADLVLHARNAEVLKDLRELMAAEPGVRSIAIFYGAAHMVDFERRLTREMGYRPAGTVWVPAMRADPKDAGFTPPKKTKKKK